MVEIINSVIAGGGVSSDEVTATKGDVLKGKTALTNDSGDEVATGTLELTGNAYDNAVRKGYTYYNTDAKTKHTGTMDEIGNVNKTLGFGESYTVPWGLHYGQGTVKAKTIGSLTEVRANSKITSSTTYTCTSDGFYIAVSTGYDRAKVNLTVTGASATLVNADSYCVSDAYYNVYHIIIAKCVNGTKFTANPNGNGFFRVWKINEA